MYDTAKDLEKAAVAGNGTTTSVPSSENEKEYGTSEQVTGSAWTRFADSFKRNPNARVVTIATDENGVPLAEQPPAEPALSMNLKNRHLQMIAIGGSIGKCYPLGECLLNCELGTDQI